MTTLAVQAAWALVAAFSLSLVYEIWRATAKAGTSRHDSMDSFVKNNVALYVVAALVIGLLCARFDWAPLIGLVFVAAALLLYQVLGVTLEP